MANLNITRLLNNVRVNVPTAIDDAINYELFNALDEFFRSSLCWLEAIDFAVTSTTATYEITPTMGESTQLMQVLNSNKITVNATMSEPDIVVLQSTPTTADTLTATVALSVVDPVKRDSTPECPDWVLTKYYRGIAAGVISNLCMQMAKPYTNMALAKYQRLVFNNAIMQARMEARHQILFGAQTWNYPQGFTPGAQRNTGSWGQPQ